VGLARPDANCAVCHDHKFDPFTQKDFYQIAAFFRNTTQGALDGNVRDTAPILLMPKAEDLVRNKAIPAELEAAKQAVAARKKALRADFDKWLETAKPEDWDAEVAKIGAPSFHLPLNAEQPAEAIEGVFNGKPLAAKSKGPRPWENNGNRKGLQLDGKSSHRDRHRRGRVREGGRPLLRMLGEVGQGLRGQRRADRADGRRRRLPRMGPLRPGRRVHHPPDPQVENDAIKVATTGKTWKPEQWQHVFVTYDGSGKAEASRSSSTARRRSSSSTRTPSRAPPRPRRRCWWASARRASS
jgi:hypothetical protein